VVPACEGEGGGGAFGIEIEIWRGGGGIGLIRNLKGLSHEIDFKNFDQKFTELGLTKGRGWFLNFLGGSNEFKTQKVYLLRLMLFCVGLIMVSCLFLSVPLITSRV
jgi:hypothetical protein